MCLWRYVHDFVCSVCAENARILKDTSSLTSLEPATLQNTTQLSISKENEEETENQKQQKPKQQLQREIYYTIYYKRFHY